MGFFSPYKSDDAHSEAETAKTTSGNNGHKSGPTMSRRDAQEARREQLRPTLSRAQQRARARKLSQDRANKAMDDLENSPERKLLRNFLDARWTFSEFTWPVLLLAFAAILAAFYFPKIMFITNWLVWGIAVVILLEAIFLWQVFKKELRRRYPRSNARGLVMYMVARMMTMRRLRRPPAAIKRGEKY